MGTLKMNQWQQARLEAALDYADKGWRVLPVGLDKKPINHNGSTGATTDAKQILKWWMDHPFANIGIACGPESFWVVDLDMKASINGPEELAKWYGQTITVADDKLAAKTPTGGFHFLFKYPEGTTVNNAQGILPGVDIRGDGGYIVVAPSARKIGDNYVAYRWNNGALPIANAPVWALKLLLLQSEKQGQPFDVSHAVSGLSAGERDTELYRFACSMAARAVPYDMAHAFLTTACDRCTPPFSHSNAEEKLKRAYSLPRAVKEEGIHKLLSKVRSST